MRSIFISVWLLILSITASCDSVKGDINVANEAYTKKDYKSAFEQYKKLAGSGNAVAQFNLGNMYSEGQGVPQNEEAALKWYRKAAEQGNANAQYNLGVMYAYGRGTKKDDIEAAKWYQKAAEQGKTVAQETPSKDEVLRYVGEKLFEISLDNWGKTATDALKHQSTENCGEESELNPCDTQRPVEDSLSILVQGLKVFPNKNGAQSRFVALVELGHEVLSDDEFYNSEQRSYQCALLVRVKINNSWEEEFLDKIVDAQYEGGTRYAQSCYEFKLSWDAAGYPVLEAPHLSGPYAGGNYSRSLQTIHFVDGTYKYDVEILEEGPLTGENTESTEESTKK